MTAMVEVPKCKVKTCMSPAKSRRMCSLHYSRLRRTGTLKANPNIKINEGKICKIRGCEMPAQTKLMCVKHYKKAWFKERSEALN